MSARSTEIVPIRERVAMITTSMTARNDADVASGRRRFHRKQAEAAADFQHARFVRYVEKPDERGVRHPVERGEPILFARLRAVDVGVRRHADMLHFAA